MKPRKDQRNDTKCDLAIVPDTALLRMDFQDFSLNQNWSLGNLSHPLLSSFIQQIQSVGISNALKHPVTNTITNHPTQQTNNSPLLCLQ